MKKLFGVVLSLFSTAFVFAADFTTKGNILFGGRKRMDSNNGNGF